MMRKRCLMGVIGALAVGGAVAGTVSDPIKVRPTDVRRWQVSHGDSDIGWRWETSATRATLVVSNRTENSVRAYDVVRTAGAKTGVCEDVLPSVSNDRERLFDLVLTQYEEQIPVSDACAARVVLLPETIAVNPVGSREFRNVDSSPRIILCETAERLSAVPAIGDEVELADPAAVGYNVFCAERTLGNAFTLKLGDRVSEMLHYVAGGLVIFFN